MRLVLTSHNFLYTLTAGTPLYVQCAATSCCNHVWELTAQAAERWVMDASWWSKHAGACMLARDWAKYWAIMTAARSEIFFLFFLLVIEQSWQQHAVTLYRKSSSMHTIQKIFFSISCILKRFPPTGNQAVCILHRNSRSMHTQKDFFLQTFDIFSFLCRHPIPLPAPIMII